MMRHRLKCTHKCTSVLLRHTQVAMLAFLPTSMEPGFCTCASLIWCPSLYCVLSVESDLDELKSWWWQDTSYMIVYACATLGQIAFKTCGLAGTLQHSALVSVGAFCFEPCAPSSFWLTHTRMRRTWVCKRIGPWESHRTAKKRTDSVRDTQKSQQVAKSNSLWTILALKLRFPVIANRCNFELWFVSAWLVGLGVGLMQVLVQLLVIASCAHNYQKATTPEEPVHDAIGWNLKFLEHGCEERDRLLVQGAFIALRGSDNLAPKPNCDTRCKCSLPCCGRPHWGWLHTHFLYNFSDNLINYLRLLCKKCPKESQGGVHSGVGIRSPSSCGGTLGWFQFLGDAPRRPCVLWRKQPVTHQGPLNYPYWADETMQIDGHL